jgi:hypothetical protein
MTLGTKHCSQNASKPPRNHAILRHSNVPVTEEYYIKTTEQDAVAAMQKFAAKIAAHGRSDKIGH